MLGDYDCAYISNFFLIVWRSAIYPTRDDSFLLSAETGIAWHGAICYHFSYLYPCIKDLLISYQCAGAVYTSICMAIAFCATCLHQWLYGARKCGGNSAAINCG